MRLAGDSMKWVLVALALAALAGCDAREALLGPGPDPSITRATSPLLPVDSVLREGLVVRVPLRGYTPGTAVQVSALLLDSAGNVAWRSSAARSDSGAARVRLGGIPAAALGRRLRLTALAEQGSTRAYAGSDTAGATTLAAAATRWVTVYAGRSVDLGRPVRTLVADGASGRAYFAVVGSGEVVTVGLADGVVGPAIARDGGEIWDLDVRGGVLAYLADAGSRVSFVSTAGGGSARSAVLGALSVRVTRVTATADDGTARVDTLDDAVRPYATALRLVCDSTAACGRPVAILASPTQSGGSVLRQVRSDSVGETVLVAGFQRLAGGADTVPATISVFAFDRPGGQAVRVLERSGVLGCASLQFGKRGFDAAGSSLFSAGGDACGAGARLARIDGFLGTRAAFSPLGVGTMLAEDRIREPVEVKVAADGSRVLVREPDAVWLLDRDLRVLGFRTVSPRARVAWLSGRGGTPEFMIADDDSLDVFEADRFGTLESLAMGPLLGAPLAFVALPDGSRVAVFVPSERSETAVFVYLPAR